MTNSDEAIAAAINEDYGRYPTVTQAETANQSSASNQPTKSKQLKPNCNSLDNLNVDNDVVMNIGRNFVGWTASPSGIESAWETNFLYSDLASPFTSCK